MLRLVPRRQVDASSPCWSGRCGFLLSKISLTKIEVLFGDLFGLKVDSPRIHWLKKVSAHYYSPTVKGITQKLVAGGVIYADGRRSMVGC
jgi:hypothetical protein